MTKERWLLVLRVLGAVLVLWSVVTLVSGLKLAQVGPEVAGRTYFFEDTGIPGYGMIAAVGGVIGAIMFATAYFMGRNKPS